MKRKLSRHAPSGGLKRGAGQRGAGSSTRRTEHVQVRPVVAQSRFGMALDKAVDSGGWLLIVVGLFILLPAGVMYLVSRGVKERQAVRQERVEADILAPVNIFADRLDGR